MSNGKTSYSVEEFREALKTGKIAFDGKGFKTQKQLPEFEKMVEGKRVKRRIPMQMEETFIMYKINEYKQQGKIYIPYSVTSSKNSKRIITNGNKRMLIKSRACMEYEALSFKWWKYQKKLFDQLREGKEFPLRIGFHFIRLSKQTFDYPNMQQFPMDLMVKYGWLKDDNTNFIEPIPDGWSIDKKSRGLVLTIY